MINKFKKIAVIIKIIAITKVFAEIDNDYLKIHKQVIIFKNKYK